MYTFTEEQFRAIFNTVNNVDTTLQTVVIGSDHGITPQAAAAINKSIDEVDAVRSLLKSAKPVVD